MQIPGERYTVLGSRGRMPIAVREYYFQVDGPPMKFCRGLTPCRCQENGIPSWDLETECPLLFETNTFKLTAHR